MENIKQEIDSKSTISNHLGKTYLTKKYIISYCNKLLITDLKEIIWIYPHTLKYNGKDYNSLIATNKDGKTMTITMYSVSNKNAKQSLMIFTKA